MAGSNDRAGTMSDAARPACPTMPPRRRGKGRQRLLMLLCGVLLGICLGSILAWRATRTPKTTSPHAGHDDFADVETEAPSFSEAYGDRLQGEPVCPDVRVLEATARAAEPGERQATGVIDGMLSYRIVRRTALVDGREFETDFLLVQNGSAHTLRVEHHSAPFADSDLCRRGDVVCSIPVLGTGDDGIVWIGTEDPAQAITVEVIGGSLLPTELEGRRIALYAAYLSQGDRRLLLARDFEGIEGVESLEDASETIYQGPFTLVTDTLVLDLLGSDLEGAPVLAEDDLTQTLAYRLPDQATLSPDDEDVELYVSGAHAIDFSLYDNA